MFAIVEIAGVQHRIQPSERVLIPHVSDKAGSTLTFDKVLLLVDEKGVKVGTPTIKGLAVQAKVLGDFKDTKVMVFKKKRRKGYRVMRGHRQKYTEVEITKIG